MEKKSKKNLKNWFRENPGSVIYGKKNPDYYHDDLPIKIENLTFWEIPRASFLENPINIFAKIFLDENVEN